MPKQKKGFLLIPKFPWIYSIFARMKSTKHPAAALLYILFLCAVLGSPIHTFAQDKPGLIKRLADKFLSNSEENNRNPSLIVIPSLGYSQETGFEYGLGGVYNFYLHKENLKNRSSNISASATMTTEKQKNFKLESDIWTNNNDYHFITELRLRDWPFNFYGLGMNTWDADKERVGQKMLRIKIESERKVQNQIYAGLSLKYEHLKYEPGESDATFENADMKGKEGGQYLAFGPIFSIDFRNTNTYTTKGVYLRGIFNFAPKFWGEDDFHGNMIEADARYFHPLSSKIALGSQILYRGTTGEKPPYYAHNPLGGSNSMRGYYEGRYLDKNYLSGQVEARFRIFPRIGFTLFSGIGSTFSKQHNDRWIGSAGGGIRYFYSLEHKSTLRLDYAVGEKRPGEGRQSGFYLSLSEAF